MPRQVSDEEYAWLQGKRVTADFVEGIYNDPQLNKEAKALIKKKYPNLQIADYDLETKIDAKFAAEEAAKRKAAEEAQRKKDSDDWNAARRAVQAEYSFTDDGMRELEDWMAEHAVASHEVAASYRASKNPKTSTPTFDSQYWRHEQAPNFKEIAADPEAWGRKEILSAIQRDQERARGAR